MLYKYCPPDITPKSMPQLDFSEALSTPEEKLLSRAANVASVSAAAPANPTTSFWLRGVGLSRSTWTNIIFVAIASMGGLVCAFYFFNGGELLRAAAAWPNEFLYPRPLSTEKIDVGQQPNPIDQFAKTESESGSADGAKASLEKNVRPADLQPATTLATTNPTGAPPVDPGTTILPAPPSIPGGLDLPPPTDALFQSLYQTVTSTVSNTGITRTTKSTTSSTRRKVSKTKQKLTTTTATATSTARSMTQQQTVNQSQMNMVRAPNQMMIGGGMGGIGG